MLYSGGRGGHTLNHARRIFPKRSKNLSLPQGFNVTLAVEPMHPLVAAGWTVYQELLDTLDLVRHFQSDHFKLVLDTYHFGLEPGLVECLGDFVPHISIVHLADGRFRFLSTSKNVADSETESSARTNCLDPSGLWIRRGFRCRTFRTRDRSMQLCRVAQSQQGRLRTPRARRSGLKAIVAVRDFWKCSFRTNGFLNCQIYCVPNRVVKKQSASDLTFLLVLDPDFSTAKQKSK